MLPNEVNIRQELISGLISINQTMLWNTCFRRNFYCLDNISKEI